MRIRYRDYIWSLKDFEVLDIIRMFQNGFYMVWVDLFAILKVKKSLKNQGKTQKCQREKKAGIFEKAIRIIFYLNVWISE